MLYFYVYVVFATTHAGRVTKGDRKSPKKIHPRSPTQSTGKKKTPMTTAGHGATSNVRSASPSVSKAQKPSPTVVAKEAHLKDSTPQITSSVSM